MEKKNIDKESAEGEEREDVDLGLLKKLVEFLLSLCSLPRSWSIFITILISMCINLSDGGSDIGLALLLYHSDKFKEAVVILSIDYAA